MICLKCKNKLDDSCNFCNICGANMSLYGLKVHFGIQGAESNYEHVSDEDIILNDLIKQLGKPKENFEIQKRAEDYTTLRYKDNDLVRLKYSKGAKWIRLLIIYELRDQYIDSDLFEANSKKNLWWKSKLYTDDLKEYIDIIKEILDYIDNERITRN